jgi:sodium/hydrogen antiporter
VTSLASPLLVFALTLLAAVLVSERAHRTVLSTSVLFLAAGFLCGPGVSGILSLRNPDDTLGRVSELALFAVLFNDGMCLDLRELRVAWRLPGAALLIGLPLTVLGVGAAGHYVCRIPWLSALLLGAVLGPTDPVFASAIVERPEVPTEVRRLLNVESGANDGLALPMVVSLLATLTGRHAEPVSLAGEVLLGVLIGVAVPMATLGIARWPWFGVVGRYEPLMSFTVGLLVLGITGLTGANEFLAGFAAGATIALRAPETAARFRPLGGSISELLKLAALMVFAAFLSPSSFTEVGARGYVFAALTLIVVRPLALLPAIRGRLTWPEFLAIAWFGPKGFASVFFGLLLLQAGIDGAQSLFNLAALVIVGSMVAHSSTDVPVARWFARRGLNPPHSGSRGSATS